MEMKSYLLIFAIIQSCYGGLTGNSYSISSYKMNWFDAKAVSILLNGFQNIISREILFSFVEVKANAWFKSKPSMTIPEPLTFWNVAIPHLETNIGLIWMIWVMKELLGGTLFKIFIFPIGDPENQTIWSTTDAQSRIALRLEGGTENVGMTLHAQEAKFMHSVNPFLK